MTGTLVHLVERAFEFKPEKKSIPPKKTVYTAQKTVYAQAFPSWRRAEGGPCVDK